MLDNEIAIARKNVVADGYDMSIGEIVNLYKDNELMINPNFQRLFRWDETQKTCFIESLLLGIPIPPVFVFQNEDGIWELIDGLQRLSTLFEFMGILKKTDGTFFDSSCLNGTRLLPNLANRTWSKEGTSIGIQNQLSIKRARIRVEILKKESDENAKFELFQRLNTGGVNLSEQEVRNCTAIMLNEKFFNWMKALSEGSLFTNVISISDNQKDRMYHMEQFLKFISLLNFKYSQNLDVHEYLTESLLSIVRDTSFDYEKNENIFNNTFILIADAKGAEAFKKYSDGECKGGQFSVSSFEAISYGVAKNIVKIRALSNPQNFISEKIKELWNEDMFRNNSGAGVRGTTRLSNLVPYAITFFRP